MTNLFFKDIRGNFWAMSKVVGFVKDEQQFETQEGETTSVRFEIHYLAILEGGMSTEISYELFDELTKTLITLEASGAQQSEEVGA